VLTVSPDYCGNLRDDENNVAEDNPAITIGGLNWYNINFNSINQPILNSPSVAVTDCGDDDCYRKFGSCAPCSSIEFVNWNSCFDGMDNDHDGVVDLSDGDCNGKIVNARGYNLTNNPTTETDSGGSCGNQYNDDNLGDISYIHPTLECRNEPIDCAGKIFGSDGRVCPSVYTENTISSCEDNFDNDGINGLDCYDVNCFAICGITGYNGNGPIYAPQNSSANVGVTNLVYSKITRKGVDFYYTYSYSGTSNGANIYLDLGHATDKSRDINVSVFNTSDAVILSNNCPTCGFVLFKSQPGFLRVRGTTRGSGFSITLRVPSLNNLMNPENILASTSIGAAFGSTLVQAEVVENLSPMMDGIIVEPEDGKIFVGDPIYMRGYNFTGYSGGQVHSGGAGWCKINITGAINLVLDNQYGSSERNCEYTTFVDDAGTYNFEITPYDYNGNAGTSVSKSLVVSSVAPIIYSKLTRDNGKRIYFTTNNESLDSFAGIFNGKDGLMNARFKTAISYPYNSDSCYAIIRNETSNVVSIQKIESNRGYLTTCTANVSIRGLDLKDGVYTITINATDEQGYSLETQKQLFYVCNNLSSKGEDWDCSYADFDVDGYTEGLIKPFNYSNGKILYKLSCDSCSGRNNSGQDSDGDGVDNACDNDTLTICGNGIPEYSEECDDGNVNNGDGCSADCKTETTTPGNGKGGGGGGGGGGETKCKENWVCFDWSLCKKLSDAGEELDNDNKNYIGNRCNLFSLDEDSCGFRIRFCEDLNDCSTTLTKPETLESCYYIYQPNCNDGVKNQDEVGMDCGGACEPCELPKIELKPSYWWIFILLILVCLLIVWLLYLIYLRKSPKIFLVKGDKVIKKLGHVREKYFKKLEIGSLFSWRFQKYRVISKKDNKLYVTKTYVK
ncbi:MAG: hypothetical protein PHF67_05450, partial [Candidatus Nanoarchaeia archaeon]|nr:hypothetical protein [Candidatus Nanoarchaeia archaeon]